MLEKKPSINSTSYMTSNLLFDITAFQFFSLQTVCECAGSSAVPVRMFRLCQDRPLPRRRTLVENISQFTLPTLPFSFSGEDILIMVTSEDLVQILRCDFLGQQVHFIPFNSSISSNKKLKRSRVWTIKALLKCRSRT